MDIPELPTDLLYRSAEEKEAVESLCLQLGRITYHWNVLHGTLQIIFAALMSERAEDSFDLLPGLAVWQAQKSDDGQRSLLKIFAENKLRTDPELLGAMNWVLDEVGKLSTYRNDATHSIFFFAESAEKVVKVNPLFTAASRANRLKATGHTELFNCLIHDLFALDFYATKIMAITLAPVVRPNPNLALQNKPKLLSALLVEKSPPGNPSHQSQTEGRQGRP